MEVIEPVAPDLGVGLGSEGVSEDAVASEGHPKEDPGLVAAALPYSVIKRIVRTASPGVSFDREAIAGFARIAQAFALFATDGALVELSKEAEKVKKSGKSKSNAPPVRSLKTLTADHVMRFLTAELPPIATKVASLFPDLMPGDFKPAGVQLLEKLGEQSKFAAQASPQKGVAPGKSAGFFGSAQAVPASKKRAVGGGAEPASKKPRRGAAAVAAAVAASDSALGASPTPSSAKKEAKQKAALAPAAGSAPLSNFFGASSTSARAAPPEQAEVTPVEADALLPEPEPVKDLFESFAFAQPSNSEPVEEKPKPSNLDAFAQFAFTQPSVLEAVEEAAQPRDLAVVEEDATQPGDPAPMDEEATQPGDSALMEGEATQPGDPEMDEDALAREAVQENAAPMEQDAQPQDQQSVGEEA